MDDALPEQPDSTRTYLAETRIITEVLYWDGDPVLWYDEAWGHVYMEPCCGPPVARRRWLERKVRLTWPEGDSREAWVRMVWCPPLMGRG